MCVNLTLQKCHCCDSLDQIIKKLRLQSNIVTGLKDFTMFKNLFLVIPARCEIHYRIALF